MADLAQPPNLPGIMFSYITLLLDTLCLLQKGCGPAFRSFKQQLLKVSPGIVLAIGAGIGEAATYYRMNRRWTT
jgi:hypothetical protein